MSSTSREGLRHVAIMRMVLLVLTIFYGVGNILYRKRGGTLRGLRINREILILRKPLIEVEYHTPSRKY